MNKEFFQETTTAIMTTSPSINENNYDWIVNDDGKTVMITKYKGPTDRITSPSGSLLPITTLNIPYILDNKTVTSIETGAFQQNKSFDRVVFPSTIISIGEGAFAECSELEYIAFNSDSQLQQIKTDAFKNTKIASPIIPSSVLKIENGAFNTKMLKSVTFLGNCPEITVDSFNSQTNNGNLEQKIRILYFNDAYGFDNNIRDTKFMYVSNYRMRLPVETPPSNPQSPPTTSIYRYINYFLLFVLFIVIVYVIYDYIKNKKKGSYEIEPLEPSGSEVN